MVTLRRVGTGLFGIAVMGAAGYAVGVAVGWITKLPF